MTSRMRAFMRSTSSSVPFCDKGLWGRELDSMLELTAVELLTPERHRFDERPPAELEMRLDNHLGKDGARPGPADRTRAAGTHTGNAL
jgi:hypothetical protein